MIAASVAEASQIFAGMTRVTAIHTAEREVIDLGLAFGTLTPKSAAALRSRLNRESPVATHSRCHGRSAWRVVWPESTPIYVGRGIKSTLMCP
jgi:hypothetical protein